MRILVLSVLLWLGSDANAIFKNRFVGDRSPDVVYKIGDLSKSKLTPKMIKEGLAFFKENTCVNLIDHDDEPSREVDMPIQNMPSEECQIYKGIFEIGDCISNRKTMVHEVTHFLGFCHTQNRNDWREYIKITPGTSVTTYEHPDCISVPVPEFKYDYGSGMHHDLKNAAKPLDDAYVATMGQSVRFPFSDYRSINWLYNCSGSCVTQPKCENGGYTHPRDCNKCMCNGYFTGARCETPRTLIQLNCESKREHNWALDTYGDDVLKSQAILQDDFYDHGDNFWELIEAPANTQLQVEVYSKAGSWSRAPSVTCSSSAVEVNDGDLNLVGRMFCDNPYYAKEYKFTARTNRVGFHVEYARQHWVFMTAKFTLSGCDGALPPATTTTTENVPSTETTTTEQPTTATTIAEATTTTELPTTTTTTPLAPATTSLSSVDTTTTATSTDDEPAWCDNM